MSAFNDFLSRSSLNNFQKFRESLISNRGNLSNGKFHLSPSQMANTTTLPATPAALSSIFI
jgi:hypothetical protein